MPKEIVKKEIMCLQFNEISAHGIKTEELIILEHGNRPISKTQLKNNVFEHFYVSVKVTQDDSTLYFNNEDAKTLVVKSHAVSIMDPRCTNI